MATAGDTKRLQKEAFDKLIGEFRSLNQTLERAAPRRRRWYHILIGYTMPEPAKISETLRPAYGHARQIGKYAREIEKLGPMTRAMARRYKKLYDRAIAKARKILERILELLRKVWDGYLKDYMTDLAKKILPGIFVFIPVLLYTGDAAFAYEVARKATEMFQDFA